MASIKENTPFANALLELGQEDGKEQEYLEELLKVQKVMEDQPDLVSFLRYPAIGKQEKTKLMESIFKEDLDPRVMQFIKVLCMHRKTADLPEIAQAYEQLYDQAQGIERVHVFSASALSNTQIEKLKKKLEDQLHHSIRMEVTVDPSLIAGLKIRTENAIMDNSIKGRLDTMKDQLMKAEG